MATKNKLLGPLMVDLQGYTLSNEECELLQHPLMGGVILFSRNYESPQQMITLTTKIRTLRTPPLLIAVDQEGGRVQRFRQGFVHLPACAKLGQLHDHNEQQALIVAKQIGWLMAVELRVVGVDFSFAPVLDLRKGISEIIGDRAFHTQPETVTKLAQAMMKGMQAGGMTAVGKHFPGHGSVTADSHHAIPIDERGFVELRKDLLPFEHMILYGLPAIMSAHVTYPQVDPQPATFSTHWLQTILRSQFNFQGVIFSDDLSMVGASVVGDILARIQQALQAGCDMVLLCNDREAVIRVIDNLSISYSPISQIRLMRLYGQTAPEWKQLHTDKKWLQAQQVCCELK